MDQSKINKKEGIPQFRNNIITQVIIKAVIAMSVFSVFSFQYGGGECLKFSRYIADTAGEGGSF